MFAFLLLLLLVFATPTAASEDWLSSHLSNQPDCAMTGDCSRLRREIIVVCRPDDRCRVAPPNWSSVVLTNAKQGTGDAPGDYLPQDQDLGVVPLPGSGVGLLLAVSAFLVLRRRKMRQSESGKNWTLAAPRPLA